MIRVVKLNSEGDPVGTPAEFATVEEGQKWSEEQRGAPLIWGEEGRFFSLEGMTKEETERLGEEGEYPPLRFWIAGVEDDGTERELEDADFEQPGEITLERN